LNTLKETALDESAGVSSLSSGYTGIVIYYNGMGSYTYGSEAGPIDWSGNGIVDATPVIADLNQIQSSTETMTGYRDWDHDAVGGGACTTSADCRVNFIRELIHDFGSPGGDPDPSVDPHEPCVKGRCQSLWFAFQGAPWGMADGPSRAVVYEHGPPPAHSRPSGTVKLHLEGGEYFLGSEDAPLTLIEFSDYQCSFCRQFHRSTFAELRARYIDTGKVRFISRDLPLGTHPDAVRAAEAVRCAGEQGRYWEMRDALLTGQAGLGREAVGIYAQQLSLEMAGFNACVDTGRYSADIQREIAEAAVLAVNATPTFVIGKSEQGVLEGVRVSGAQPMAAFDAAIRQAAGTLQAAQPDPHR
jgi:protein-disulfide isomerase